MEERKEENYRKIEELTEKTTDGSVLEGKNSSEAESSAFDIEKELKKLPGKPGVYLMHNEKDEIIYIGKAVNLKNRVRQYFQSSRGKTAKINSMVSHIHRFEYIVTDSESEALVLESNLIKEHRPRYNTMLKDDKNYPYIRVTVEEPYPRVLFAHKMEKNRSRYFGPYTNSEAVRETIDLLQKVYQIRTCQRVLPRDFGKERPCLNQHLGRCLAPCTGQVDQKEYGDRIAQVIDFLSGKTDDLTKELKDQMKKASDELRFEDAISCRDLLDSVSRITEKQKMTNVTSLYDRDVLAFAADGSEGIMQVFFVREGKMIGREHFRIAIAEGDDDVSVMTSFVKQYYAGTPFVPKVLYLSTPLAEEEEESILAWLSEKRGSNVHVQVPERGENHRLVALAKENAQMVLDKDKERIRKEEEKTAGAMRQIASWIGLSDIHRVEAFDISDINGFESVGSMVVFYDGKEKHSDYRRFRIRTVKGADDYASLREVLHRRFEHGLREKENAGEGGFAAFPDLLMMDGGKGQVHVAKEVLEEYHLSIPVVGMVKDDRHRTRGLYYQDQEIPVDPHSDGFHLLTHIQDEVHRFAIEYHRNLRNKESTHSILDDIEGIGPKRRKELIYAFGSLEKVREADVAELAAVPLMNQKTAQSVYDFFHSKETVEVEEIKATEP